jgi:hypothetical protein
MQSIEIPSEYKNEEIKGYVLERLEELGFPQNNLLLRFFSPSRLENMLSDGTDRDSSSETDGLLSITNLYAKYMNYNPIDAKESKAHQAMIRNGLNPKKDNDKVTYCSKLPLWFVKKEEKEPIGIAAYDGTKLKLLDDGLGMYEFISNPRDALITVFYRK